MTRQAPRYVGALLLITTLPLIAVAQATSADTTVRKKHATMLDATVVTATRTRETVREVPANVVVLGTRDIRMSAARSVSDFLRIIPGYTTKDYQSSLIAHPSRQAPALRGLGGTSASRTLVLLDGIPMNEPFAGWVHWPRIPLALIENVEVVRGGGIGVWGDRALGGVINLITRNPQENAVLMSASGGSMGTVRSSAVATGRSGRLGLLFAADYSATDGFVNVRNDVRTPIDRNVDSRLTSVYGKALFDVSPALQVHGVASFMDDYRRNGTALKDNRSRVGEVRGGMRYLARGGSLWTGRVYGSLTTHGNYFTSESVDRTSETPSLDQFDVPATAAGAQLQWAREVAQHHQLSAGADVSWVDGEVNEDLSYVQGAFTRRRRVAGEQLMSGGYVQDAISIGSTWRLLGSLRFDRWENRGAVRREPNRVTNAALVDTSYASAAASRVSYNVGVRHQTTAALALRASTYSGYRSPTLNELYKPFRDAGNVIVEANDALRPERLIGVDIGADYIFNPAVLGRVTTFWNRVDDPILDVTLAQPGGTGRNIPPCGFVPAGGACRQRQNLDVFRTLGIEAELEARLAEYWSLRGSYGWNPTEILEARTQPALVGKVARGTARHQYTASLAFEKPSLFDASLTNRYVDARFEDDLNALPLESFFVTDVRVGRAFTRKAYFFLSAENLLDAEYAVTRSASGLVRIGTPRFVEAGVRYRW